MHIPKHIIRKMKKNELSTSWLLYQIHFDNHIVMKQDSKGSYNKNLV